MELIIDKTIIMASSQTQYLSYVFSPQGQSGYLLECKLSLYLSYKNEGIMANLGLVLSGGGARGAYQAGALAAIGDICKDLKIENPFTIYTGVSAGAINVSFLAADPKSFLDGTKTLTKLWSQIESDQVFVSDAMSLSRLGLQWMTDLSLGGMKKATPGKALLDTSPLGKLISENCRFENIQKNINAKKFLGVAISAMDYANTNNVTFTQAHESLPVWTRVRRHMERTDLSTDHVLASAAIPLLFPPVGIENRYFGDGCIRNLSPCGPAIYMGAQKLIAIGVRKKQDLCYSYEHHKTVEPPSAARVVNVLLNAIMMDGMEVDLERIDRINENLRKLDEIHRSHLSVKQVEYVWISPSYDIAEIAATKSNLLPRTIRYMLKGLGNIDEASEIISYLLFESGYCKKLIDMGYEDTMKQKVALAKFIVGEKETKKAS
jgi:Predicted esterase of the alpha-beta hydrolase superfamily